MIGDKRSYELEALTLLIGKGLVYLDSTNNFKDIKVLDEFICKFLLETAHWVCTPSKIHQSHSKAELLLKLWLDRVEFLAKWTKSSFRFYNLQKISCMFQKLRIITDSLEILDSNILLFYNNRQVDSVLLQFFSLLRILRNNYNLDDLTVIFESGNGAFMIAALELIEKGIELEIEEAGLIQLIKVRSCKNNQSHGFLVLLVIRMNHSEIIHGNYFRNG